jgi:N-carbamoyl-L-amino-acid hydrolase
MPQIDPDRLLSDLRTLRNFGACGTGVVRQAFTPVDMDARRWLAGRMSEAGLDASIDGVGNVVGRSRNPGPALLVGSHSDTQPNGGWLDGAMGVIYAIELARALRDDPATRDYALDAISWQDEEGAYFGFLGSRSFCNDAPADAIDRATGIDGKSLRAAMAEAGLADVAPRRLEPGRHVAYLEAHIEQGGRLEAERKRIGIVTDIVGIREFTVTFGGKQNHAGTTPMPIRRDAGAALMRFATELDARFKALAGPNTVWTVGRVQFFPGAPSIIPGRAEMIVQMRDPQAARLQQFAASLHALGDSFNRAGPVTVAIAEPDEPTDPSAMDEGLQRHLTAAAEKHAAGNWIPMPSGAGHDAQIVARFLPSAMLFVPSIGGVSHDFSEDTADADIALGCQVLADAAASILKAAQGR